MKSTTYGVIIESQKCLSPLVYPLDLFFMTKITTKTDPVRDSVFAYVRGNSKQSIADSLNASKLSPPNLNRKWKPEDIDPFIASVGKLVTVELLEILKEVRKIRRDAIKFPSLLKGKLHCRFCGYNYVTQTVGYKNYRQRYYICQSKSRKAETCQSIRINADVLESRIMESILGLKKQKGLKKLNNERVHSEIFELLKDVKIDSPFVWRFTLAQLLIKTVNVKTRQTANKIIPDITVETRISVD